MIELEPAQKYSISELQNRDVQVLNSTAIASGYVGRDPQGGLAIEAFKVCIEIFVKKNEGSSLF